jgi:hypothetical protein
MRYGNHKNGFHRCVIDQQVRKPSKPVPAGAVQINRPALRVSNHLLLGVVELAQEQLSSPPVSFSVPLMCFPSVFNSLGMKLIRRVVHLPQSSAGPDAKE